MSNSPILRVSFKRGDQNFNVLTVWDSPHPGLYSVSRDKPSEKYQTISLIDVIKAFVAGEGFVNVRVMSQSEQRRDGGGSRSNGGASSSSQRDDFGGSSGGYGSSDDPDLPFDRKDRGIQC